MPHLLIEYSGNLLTSFENSDVLKLAHGEMLNCGLFTPKDIKSRAHIATDFLIGEDSEKKHTSFIHAFIYILHGRTLAQKQALAKAVFHCLELNIPNATHVSVDIQEMSADTYLKKIV
jgi:5-carboxymethyl-2-hydroxymuconate isomerase